MLCIINAVENYTYEYVINILNVIFDSKLYNAKKSISPLTGSSLMHRTS